MIKRIFFLIVLLVVPQWVIAEEVNLQEQIDAIKSEIMEQEQLQEQLKADLASKDEEISRLKQQLEELEKKIAE